MIYEKVLLDERNENVYIKVYVPEKNDAFVRDAILVIPGGGYGFVGDSREGEPIALDFVQKGLAAFVLNYSVKEKAKFPAPLIETSKAMKHIRDNADIYNINPERVFVTGFSAGGHLTACLGTLWHIDEIYKEVDMPYGYNKPTGILPIYPVITSGEHAHKGTYKRITGSSEPVIEMGRKYSPELHVDEKSSPAFICHTSDDEIVSVHNSLCLAKAYADANMKFELHIFKEGPHGMALGNEITKSRDNNWISASFEKWTELAKLWMSDIK